MPRGPPTSKPYEKSMGPDGLETHFEKCPVCGRKILVQIGLFGVSHNLGVTAVCGDCIRDKGVDPKYRAEARSMARRIEAWARRTRNDERILEAMRRIKLGQWTVRRAAKFAGLEYHELLNKMAEKGVDSGPTLNEFRESRKVRETN